LASWPPGNSVGQILTATGEWRVFSAVRTRLNCTVQYQQDSHQIWCACHNGLFDLNGRVVGGPPLAESGGASRALLLGHVMAHEIGHLLLGVNSHANTGLMHVPWDRDQREKAYLGTLLFTNKEAEQIRHQAAARLRAAQFSH
jgi:hypothetical protein